MVQRPSGGVRLLFFGVLVEEVYTQQERAHIRRLHPDWAARRSPPAISLRLAGPFAREPLARAPRHAPAGMPVPTTGAGLVARTNLPTPSVATPPFIPWVSMLVLDCVGSASGADTDTGSCG
jgi:hypothetical protein